jgi:hypothetical protein
VRLSANLPFYCTYRKVAAKCAYTFNKYRKTYQSTGKKENLKGNGCTAIFEKYFIAHD